MVRQVTKKIWMDTVKGEWFVWKTRELVNSSYDCMNITVKVDQESRQKEALKAYRCRLNW